MSHSLHTAYAHHFECFCYHNKNIQNGRHKQCESYVTLKEKLSWYKNIQNDGHKQCEGYVTLKDKLSW